MSQPARQANGENSFDFIIVGSGAGGGPLAANLAKAGFRVLVLEAGGWDEPEVARVPAFHPHASEHPDLSWEFYVKHYSDPEEPDSKWDAAKAGIFYPRASTVGGCTMHNAMITICGPSGSWDEIAGLTGDPSWSGNRMRAYFERLERCGYSPPPQKGTIERVASGLREALGIRLNDNPGRHGFDGWLHTSMADPRLAARDPELLAEILAALAAAKDEGVESVGSLLKDLSLGKISRHVDPNHWETLEESPQGIALIPLAVRDGQRNGPRDYLREVQKLHPQRLVIQTETLATSVLFDREAGAAGPPRAIGVRFLRGKGLYRAHPSPTRAPGAEGQAYCRREVVLCGGAYNTPQLLKLSGVGPAAELERFSIPLVVDLPGVGTNLQDRYEVGIISEARKDFPVLRGLELGEPKPGEEPDAALEEWRKKKTGLYASNAALLGLFRKSRPDLPAPDLFIFALPGHFKGYYKGYSRDIAMAHNRLTWAILKAHTKNRAGTVNLRTADPLDPPEINFHYFNEGTDVENDDLAAMVEGVRIVRGIHRHAAAKGVLKGELWPGSHIESDDAIREFVKREAWGHHASCSCPIGADGDPMAVLDSRFRVRGTSGLRVVDASIFPRIPGVFIVTNIYMASEKASDVIAEDNKQ